MSFRDSLVAEVVVECDECATTLVVTAVDLKENQIHISVRPCPACEKDAEDRGEATGYNRGYIDGQDEVEQDADTET